MKCIEEFMGFLHEFMEVGELEGDEKGKRCLFHLYLVLKKTSTFWCLTLFLVHLYNNSNEP